MADEGRRLVVRSRDPGRMSDLYNDGKAPDVYVDGVGGAAVGPAVARLSFFRTYDVVPSDTPEIPEDIELRQVNLNLIIPTASLIEFAAGIMASAAAGRDGLTRVNATVLESVDRALAVVREAMPKGH